MFLYSYTVLCLLSLIFVLIEQLQPEFDLLDVHMSPAQCFLLVFHQIEIWKKTSTSFLTEDSANKFAGN